MSGSTPAQLLDHIESYIRKYVALPSDAAYIATVLWAVHAHAADAAESTPRLAFLSPEPECGKTRALEVLETLVPSPMLSVNASPAALFRAVSDMKPRPTILFDEIDTIFGPRAKEHEELRGLLNAGHRRSGVAHRCVGEGTNQQVRSFPAYAVVAMAGIGDLPDTILSRSIRIPMRRRTPGELVSPFRQRRVEPVGHQLRDEMAEWVQEIFETLRDADPKMPDGVVDRAADVWEPLLSIADTVGSNWPERARAACVELVTAKLDAEPSLGVRLLADLRDIFGDSEVVATESVLDQLRRMDEAPWGDMRGKPLDARYLARLLGKYGIKSGTIRIGGTTPKGYKRTDLADAWNRYLPPLKTPPHAPHAPHHPSAVHFGTGTQTSGDQRGELGRRVGDASGAECGGCGGFSEWDGQRKPRAVRDQKSLAQLTGDDLADLELVS